MQRVIKCKVRMTFRLIWYLSLESHNFGTDKFTRTDLGLDQSTLSCDLSKQSSFVFLYLKKCHKAFTIMHTITRHALAINELIPPYVWEFVWTRLLGTPTVAAVQVNNFSEPELIKPILAPVLSSGDEWEPDSFLTSRQNKLPWLGGNLMHRWFIFHLWLGS